MAILDQVLEAPVSSIVSGLLVVLFRKCAGSLRGAWVFLGD